MSNSRSGSLRFTSSGISIHASSGSAGLKEQLRLVVQLRQLLAGRHGRGRDTWQSVKSLALTITRSMLGSRRCPAGGAQGSERRHARLIPVRHARKIVFSLVPVDQFAVRVLVDRRPAVVLERDLDRLLENDRIGQVPAVAADVAADQPIILIVVRRAEKAACRSCSDPRLAGNSPRCRCPRSTASSRRRCRFSRRPRRTSSGFACAPTGPCRRNAPCPSCRESRNPCRFSAGIPAGIGHGSTACRRAASPVLIQSML